MVLECSEKSLLRFNQTPKSDDSDNGRGKRGEHKKDVRKEQERIYIYKEMRGKNAISCSLCRSRRHFPQPHKLFRILLAKSF